MKAYVFPGQGSQFIGMGKDFYEETGAKELFERANEILGFRITDVMFHGTGEDLKRTNITQPAIFLHSVILLKIIGGFNPDMVAGHSLGEFSALVAAKALSFEDGLRLVMTRAQAMQTACGAEPSSMAAVLGLDDKAVEEVLSSIDDVVVPANYNGPKHIVISGSMAGVNIACKKLEDASAKRIIRLNVAGAFHSPLMEPARTELLRAVNQTTFNQPICPIYQNVNAKATINPDVIRENLIAQLTSPVRWSQSILTMVKDGADLFIEVGPGKILQNLIKRIAPDVERVGIDSYKDGR